MQGEEWVRVYHGSIGDASSIRAFGLSVSQMPTWVTRDLAASRNAIDPRVRADRLTDAGIIEALVPKIEFDRMLAASERAYFGFNGILPGSSEIVLRTPE